MTISEVISALEAIQCTYGDLTVYTEYDLDWRSQGMTVYVDETEGMEAEPIPPGQAICVKIGWDTP